LRWAKAASVLLSASKAHSCWTHVRRQGLARRGQQPVGHLGMVLVGCHARAVPPGAGRVRVVFDAKGPDDPVVASTATSTPARPSGSSPASSASMAGPVLDR
jgi:hypothetical protein